MTKRTVLFLFLTLAAALASAAPPRYQYTYYTKHSGLNRAMIEAVAQDGNGCLWLASWSGLFRYDGRRFTCYKVGQTGRGDDKTGRESNRGGKAAGETIRTGEGGGQAGNRFDRVYADAFGQLWVRAYDNTLYRFDLRRESFERAGCEAGVADIFRLTPDDFRLLTTDNTILTVRYSDMGRKYELREYMKLDPGVTVTDIRKDADDNVWVLTDRTLFRNCEPVSSRPAFCYEEADGSVYIGSEDGLIVEFINGRVFEIDTRSGRDIKMICKVSEAPEFLIGSAEDGLSFISFSDWGLSPVGGNAYFEAEPRSLKDGNGNIWIYSPGGGIGIFDAETRSIEPFYCGESDASVWDAESNIRCAFIDRQNNIWIAGNKGGVGKAVLTEYKFSLVPMGGDASSTAGNSVRALMQRGDGVICAGTKDGKVHLFDRNLRFLTRWDVGEQVYALSEDGNGRIWAGTKGKGAVENTSAGSGGTLPFRPRSYRETDGPRSTTADLVYCVRPDRSGRVWIASFDGRLSFVDTAGGRRKYVGTGDMPGFPEDNGSKMRYVIFGPDGKMYVCGRPGLLSCDNPDAEAELLRFESFRNLSECDIQHILFTSDGQAYASTFGNGFLHLDSTESGSGFSARTVADGLLSDFVMSAVEDRSGNIWIVTHKGLNRLNPKTGSITGYSYDRIGYKFAFNEGEPLLAKTGRILLNTSSGILHFNPEEISGSSYVPKVFVRTCHVSGKRVFPSGGTLKIHNGESVTVDFTAVDMSAQENISCSWRIDGGEGAWARLSDGSAISLDGLKPGRHALEMRATNADGLDVDNAITLMIIVRPNPLLTAVIVLLVLSAASGLTIMRLRRRSAHIAVPAAVIPDEGGAEDAGESLSGDDLRFKKAFQAYLEENLDNGEVTAEDIAAALHLSRSTLFERCRTLLGTAPTEYLRELRFKKAGEMIREGGYSISQIAYKTGFNDAHYFSKAFRKRFGKTPTEYRKTASDA